jgi:hypothetical protein
MTDFEYLPCDGTETDLNEDGEHTGEFVRVYGDPVPYRGSFNAPSGRESITFYGDDIRYTHTLTMDDPNTEINEYGLIRWKGDLYDIQAVRPSLNFLSIALQKQTKAHNDPYIPENEPDGDGE